MKLLCVHERSGSLAGAEANAHIATTELGQRGHASGILHGLGTGKGEPAWQCTFPFRAPPGANDNAAVVRLALADFQPDAIYVNTMADLGVIEALAKQLGETDLKLVSERYDFDDYIGDLEKRFATMIAEECK